MQTAPIPVDERKDWKPYIVWQFWIQNPKKDSIVSREATEKLKVPISTIAILDSNREWFKSCTGLDQKESDQAISFVDMRY